MLYYLLCINVIAAIIYTIDSLLHKRQRPGIKPVALLDLTVILGGTVGALLVMLIFDIINGKARRPEGMPDEAWHAAKQRYNEKYRARMYAIFWLILQVTLCLILFGPKHEAALAQISEFYHAHIVLVWCLAAVNAVSFIAFGVEKILAIFHRRRIPEVVLLGLSLAGGAAGSLLGMDIFHHKVTHPEFSVCFPLLLVAELVLFFCYALQLI